MKENSEWMFDFLDGGWNTVWAATKEEAVAKAKQDYPKLRPVETSFRRVAENQREYRIKLAEFW